MYKVMKEARDYIDMFKKQGLHTLVLTEFTTYWPRAPIPNPLPVVWVNYMDIGRPQLMDRVKDAMIDIRHDWVILWSHYHWLHLTLMKDPSIDPPPLFPQMQELKDLTKKHYQFFERGRHFDVYVP